MTGNWVGRGAAALAASATWFAFATAQTYQPPQHSVAPPLVGNATAGDIKLMAEQGTAIDRGRSARWTLAEHRRLDQAIAGIGPGRKGVVDAFVVAVALDSDPVFGREAREAGVVLTRRYDAAARSVTLAGSDGARASSLPMGSPANLAAVLARVAEQMNPEDVLVLYTTSHGAPFGIVYNDGDQGFGAMSGKRLAAMLDELGIRNRLLLVSACYAGMFVAPLASDTTAILTAASATRTSFGCQADSDWTFFGDATINHALRQPQPLAAAAAEAKALIAAWEKRGKLKPSQPQVSIGKRTGEWLTVLEQTLPPASDPAGRPAVSLLDEK